MKQNSRYATSPKRDSDGKTLKEYRVWYGIHDRVMNKDNPRYLRYKDTAICDSWNSYDNFYEDMQSKPFFNSYCLDGRSFVLDKDMFSPLSKPLYSNETTVCVPHEINTLLSRSQQDKKSGLPLGICYTKDGLRYSLSTSFPTANKRCREFKNLNDAIDYYLYHKKLRVGSVANKYKGLVDDKVYCFLLNLDLEYWYFNWK